MILEKENHYLFKIMVFFFINLPLIIYCQTDNQEFEIAGKIHYQNHSIESAHIINISTSKNTVSDQKGAFNLAASINDTIEVRCLAYKLKTVIVSEEIIKNKTLQIKLSKQVNELREIVVSRSGLSGDLEKDLLNIPYNVIDPSKKLGINVFEGEPQEKIPTVIQTFGLSKEGLKNLEIVPVIKIEPLYKHISGYYKKLKDKRNFDKETKTVNNILYLYGSSFFQTNYKIDTDQVYNFLFFCIKTDESLIIKFENKNYSEVLKIFNKKALTFDK